MNTTTTRTHGAIHRNGRQAIAAFCLAAAFAAPALPATFTVTVTPDGAFKPNTRQVFDGDTVIWKLADPKTDAIVRMRTGPLLVPASSSRKPKASSRVVQQPGDIGVPFLACRDYRAYDATDPNEFTGPMPRSPSGIFTLGPDGPGLQEKAGPACEQSACQGLAAPAVSKTGTRCLCGAPDGVPYASMSSTWSDRSITGVFIRLRWNEVHTGPNRFEWDALDREIMQAVAQGKLYSIGVKAGRLGTPDWIETDAKAPVRRLRFVDHGSDDGDDDAANGGGCGKEMFLGSPADDNYRTHYFAMLTALAAHLRDKSAWYRSLAYVKPSGINLFSHENRAPKNCAPGCTCNPEVWATRTGYTPSELAEFYREQLTVLAREFPGKDMAYALIHAGFPLVGEHGEFEGQSPAPAQIDKNKLPCTVLSKGQLPWATQQTECILEEGARDHAGSFVVQHNGLGPACGDRDGNGKDECLPQNLAVQAGKDGGIIGFQTNNASRVANNKELDDALENGWCNSEATFIEIYEQRLWDARNNGPTLDATSPQVCDLTDMKTRSLDSWSAKLLARRNSRGRALALPEFQAGEHRHTFKRTVNSGSQIFHYAHASKCAGDRFATITIAPPLAADAATLRKTATAGLEDIPPADKNPTSQLPTLTQDTTIGLRGLTLREAPGRACQLSLWYSNLRGQPPRSITLQNTATVSGASSCAGGEPDKTVLFETESQYVHGLRVCTGDNFGVRGVEVFGAKVNDDATVTTSGQPSQRMTLNGCKTWSNTVACGPRKIAVGVTTFFDASRGYVGVGLQCRDVVAQK